MAKHIEWSHLGPADVTVLRASIAFESDGPHYLLGRGRQITDDVAILRTRYSALAAQPDPSTRTKPVVSVIFLLDGSVTFDMSGERIAAGQAACFLGTIAAHRSHSAVDAVHVAIDAAALHRFGIDIRTFDSGVRLASHLIGPARAFFTTLLNTPEPEGGEKSAAESILHVIAVLLLDHGRLTHAPVPAMDRESRILRARRLIVDEAADPALTPESIAQRLGVSVRTLQRQFRRGGSSLAAEIRDERLWLALHALGEGGAAETSIHDAAIGAGFTSTRQLREAMKSQLGATPRSVRTGTSGSDDGIDPVERRP